MKKTSLRIPCLLIALLSATSFAVSCGSAEPVGNADSTAPVANNPVETEPAETEEPRILADLPERDFGGYEFKVLHWMMDGWETRAARDIYAEKENGDTLNDAVYKRNTTVGERFNMKVTMENVDFAQMNNMVKKAVTAGDDAYDLVYIRLYEGKSLMTTGVFLNIAALPYVDLSKPWWDANLVSELSYDGKLYMAASDINIEDKNATAGILFNKALASNYDVENLYELVKQGKWTIEKMKEIYSNVSTDINGDGVMDENDLWGFLGARDVAPSFFLGGMGRFTNWDKDGNLVDVFNTEHNIALSQKIYDVMMDTANFYNHHTGTQNAPATDDNEYRDMFAGGHGLFFWARLDEVSALRSLETDFGILPTPKYDEAQENYASLVSQHITALMTVPTTASDPERTGIILEALAAESKYTVQPAYYDITLKSKALRDDDSAEMLDIIFANRHYDFGEMFDFGGWSSEFVSVMESKTKNVTSSYEKKVKAITKDIDKMLKALMEME
ncbi:MAG: hypothetical protein MJ175_08980 [Clostridia bacterium]|nr:hypothetical protein [Clostridia bacterium]